MSMWQNPAPIAGQPRQMPHPLSTDTHLLPDGFVVHAADIRAQLVFREVDGWWDWEAGPYCSRSAYRTDAEAEANFEAVLIEVLEP